MGFQKKIWIAGADGKMGIALNKVIDPLEIEVFNTDKEEIDIADMDAVLSFGEINRPDVIINCAGVTDTIVCEVNPDYAYKINAMGARNLSVVANKIGAKFVQFSTDDVFDGISKRPYCEFDDTNPLTIYGRSKRAGENYVKEFTTKHYIIRSNWVYGEGGAKKDFVDITLEDMRFADCISGATDQHGSPTSAVQLARLVLKMIETNEYGTYHITNSGVCSRYEFAQEIAKLAGSKTPVKAITTEESAFEKVRPAFAVLDNMVLRILEEEHLPDWKEALAEYLQEHLKK